VGVFEADPEKYVMYEEITKRLTEYYQNMKA